jgi:hypothetical protein
MVGSSPPRTPAKAVWGGTELVEMLVQKPRQLGMGGHNAAVSLGPVLELPSLPRTPVVRPLAARVGRRAAEVQLAPILIVGSAPRRQDHVLRSEVDRFLGAEPRVVQRREEGDEPRAARLLRSDCFQQCPCLVWVHNAAPVY